MSHHHVVVIGGGPIGSVAARSAAEAGARVLLIERGGAGDAGSLCTGLVSPRTLPALGVSEASVLRRIRGVEAHAPGGRRLTIRADETKAVVLDRAPLEAELRERASDAGAEIRLRCEAVGLRRGAVDVRSSAGRETISAGVVVVAAGLDSALCRAASLPRPARLFHAAQAIVESEPERGDEVRVFVGREVAPLFFAWAVPAEPGRTRVGLAAPAGTDPGPFLDRLLGRRFADAAIRERRFGRIPIGPLPQPIGDGCLLVGDAAGQVKPLSGGGLYTGAICARIGGRAAAAAALDDRVDRAMLERYAVACDRAVGGELRFGLAARDVLESLSDSGIDEAFAALDDPELLRFVAAIGDIDRLHRLPRGLASRRKLWTRLLPLLTLLDRHLATL